MSGAERAAAAVERRPRWLILTQYYAPEIGAPQIRLRALARELRRRGIEVEVLTAFPNYPAGRIFPGYAGRLAMREEIDGVAVRRTWIYAATGKSAAVRLANYLSFTCSALGAALFGTRPDLLFVESQPLSLGAIAVLMKWLRGVPYVYNVPDLQIDVARQLGFMQSGVLLGLALGLENFFLRRSWKVSTVTRRFIEHFRGRGLPADQITYLPNGADADFLAPRPPSAELIDRFGVRGRKVFLYVGTHAVYHGLDTLLDAAARLRDRDDLVFLMIGDGPERSRLIERSARMGLRNVLFGTSPYEEMDRLYSIAWAGVATLRRMPVSEGMRLSKVFPSLSCGVPVVYSGSGEAADLLADRECGLVVEPENPAALAATLTRLADDPDLRCRLGSNGRALVETEYSWTAIVERWLRECGPVAVRRPAQPQAKARRMHSAEPGAQ
jgi:glycosyltransferase involved in cell wall biosynthesis